jgi:hypothetical protein
MESNKRSETLTATVISAIVSIFVGLVGVVIIAAVFQSVEIMCLMVILLPLISGGITFVLLPLFQIELSQANEQPIFLGVVFGGFSGVLLYGLACWALIWLISTID